MGPFLPRGYLFPRHQSPSGRVGWAAPQGVGSQFRFWDLALEDRTFWDWYVRVAEGLGPAFEAEGYIELHWVVISTSQGARKAAQDDRVRRCLYHVC
jgi:hypothetical protein